MTELLIGFFSGWLVFAGILVLHLVVPARKVKGYVHKDDSSELLTYRLNGLPVLALSVVIWFVLGHSGIMPWDWLWQHRWLGALGGCVLGALISAVMMFRSPGEGKTWLADYYLGRMRNPQIINGRTDAKMYLYVAGAALLLLNLLSFGAHHHLRYPDDPSFGVFLYVLLFTWFICDYMIFERIHLYTYDLFAERLGFKLIWGCLAWYPYFYCVGLWGVSDLPNPDAPAWLYLLATVIFFSGWLLARGSNMQKFYFKQDPQQKFLGVFEPRTISDGERHVLCSGFWGVSRHVNYLGEILMSCGLTLALGWPFTLVPWLYPLYYIVFLLPRERDDDRRCAEKYGPLWDKYRKQVPWRIVPRVY